MANNANNDNIIETIDEHGQHVKFELVDIVEVDEVEYGLLYPIEGFDPAHPEKPGDKVVIMRLKQEGQDFIFEKIEDDEEFDNDLFHSFEQLHEILEGESTKKDDNDDNSDFVPLHEMLKKNKKAQPAKKKTRDYAYSFSAFSLMANASCAVYPLYQGESCVWKDEKNKTYYLVLSKPEMPDSMRHICSILNEFGTKEFYTQARKEYFKEHYSLFIPSGAIEKLSKL